MATESSTDLSGFFDTDQFAIAGTYDGSTTVNGILDRDYVEIGNVEGEFPVFTCVASDVSGVVHGKTLVANSTSYVVRGAQPDGTGLITLVLEEQ
jgi:hypothetical protein